MARPYRPKRWRPEMPDPAGCYLLSRSLSISPVTAQVLYNRGLTTPELADGFLNAGRGQILDPFLLKEMDRAVALIRDRIAAGGPIMVYGDYDVDGVTGTAILVLALRALGARVEYYIPNRFSEGYGLNAAALREIRERGFDFVLSVDTGVSAIHEAEVARELGITLVISDHHEPGPALPDVPALVNPKRPDCSYPFKGLSGVGVAFKLALALQAPNAWELLDIVTLGTIADMVPLVGENRAIVREGLAALGATRRPGLRALMEVAGVREPVTATHIGFALGPRINALGRMGSAMTGVELLLTEDPSRARELARHLDEENRSRQEVEAAILQEALQQAESLPPEERQYVLVLAGEGWHHGVVGICASRVLEAYHRPSILLAVDGEEARGSARSIPAFHMHRALLQVSDLFSKWGGHAMAAGMTLKRREDLRELRRRLNDIARDWLRPEDLVPEQRIDAFVTLEQVTPELVAELSALEPHGIGNPAPILAATNLQVLEARVMGKEQQHLKLMLRPALGGPVPPREAVGWNLAPARPGVGARIQVAFQPEIDTYGGRERLRLTVRDLQVIGSPEDAGPPVQVAELPLLTPEACLRWDPLAPAPEAAAGPERVLDGRDHRLPALLEQLAAPLPEAAATAEEEGEQERPEPTRLTYLQALAYPAGARLLILTASPWAAAALTAELQRALPDRRPGIRLWAPGEPEPEGAAIVVAAHGQAARGSYTETVLYHPPYLEQGYPGERLHLLWTEADQALAESALGWPYPEREALVHLYRLLRAGEATAERLAASLGEVPGPWNRLRFESGLAVFREIGLTTPDGRLKPNGNGARFDLEASARYRRGQTAREQLKARKALHA
ncbi:MAG: single-stranded-DNA-specific exonuclease RecJ [Bacillota bacterium]